MLVNLAIYAYSIFFLANVLWSVAKGIFLANIDLHLSNFSRTAHIRTEAVCTTVGIPLEVSELVSYLGNKNQLKSTVNVLSGNN